MDHSTARQLIEIIKQLDKPVNEATLLAESISDEDERRKVRKGLARIIGVVYVDLMVPICKDYPDLLPDSYKD
jgi:hypothetical protein